MKKFMNRPEEFVADSLEGFVSAHGDLITFGKGKKYIRRRAPNRGKVALISGGGAGHEPMHAGFVGQGMLDAACIGQVFTSPTPDQILAAIEDADSGLGCLLIVKNYDGDVMNFEMAAEAALAAGRRIAVVLVDDDVSGMGVLPGGKRRGVAGTVVVEKILGAAAEEGMDLHQLKRLGERVVARTRTMGVALRGPELPETARPSFTLEPDEMEVGVGIHGEPGRSRMPLANAQAIAAMICDAILSQLPVKPHQDTLLLVNGFGGTPVSELYLVYAAARRVLEERGMAITRSLVGAYATSLDSAGMSVTVSQLDKDLQRLWDAPVATPALRWGL